MISFNKIRGESVAAVRYYFETLQRFSCPEIRLLRQLGHTSEEFLLVRLLLVTLIEHTKLNT
jgi:hypothetical protein